MHDTTISRKRPRSAEQLDSASSSSMPSRTVQRSEEFWYEDGSIVPIVEDKAFRVHKSILSQCSDVFRDTFEIGRGPPAESEVFDGCPVVHVSDTQSDLGIFIRAIYNYGRDPSFVAEEAIRRLRCMCPRSFQSYKTSRAMDDSEVAITDYDKGGMSITIVNLACSFDILDVLPVAFYLCCQLPIQLLVKGLTLDNRTTEQLSLDDLTVCLEGKERLIGQSHELARRLGAKFDDSVFARDCGCSYEICRELISNVDLCSDPDILDSHSHLSGAYMCNECNAEYDQILNEIRLETFLSLPHYFGIPDAGPFSE